jgi:sugar lactone lactonase YvrE
MRSATFSSVLWLFAIFMTSFSHAETMGEPRLEIVAQMKERPGNIAVAPDGRIFVSVHPFAGANEKLLEVKSDGTTVPYPNVAWAADPDANGIGLSNVIHIAIIKDTLYILDMGARGVTPKLVAWDTKNNALIRVWYIPAHVTTAQSFLQDFVITPDGSQMFIADMGQADFTGKAEPALIHMNLETGMARRLLTAHTSIRPSGKPMMAGGQIVQVMNNGKQMPLYLALNPITMDPKGEWVYFAPMGQGLLYRARVRDLVDEKLTEKELAGKLAVVGNKPPSDGILVDAMENVFVTSVNDGSIGVINNKGAYHTWLRDPLLVWPDGLCFGPDQAIYVTVNQLHLASIFNRGEEKSTPPYMILRIIGGRPLPKPE